MAYTYVVCQYINIGTYDVYQFIIHYMLVMAFLRGQMTQSARGYIGLYMTFFWY